MDKYPTQMSNLFWNCLTFSTVVVASKRKHIYKYVCALDAS